MGRGKKGKARKERQEEDNEVPGRNKLEQESRANNLNSPATKKVTASMKVRDDAQRDGVEKDRIADEAAIRLIKNRSTREERGKRAPRYFDKRGRFTKYGLRLIRLKNYGKYSLTDEEACALLPQDIRHQLSALRHG